MKKNNPSSKKDLNGIEEKLSNILKHQEEFSEYFELSKQKETFIYDFVNKALLSNSLEEAGATISEELVNLTGFNECFMRFLDEKFNIFLENRASFCKNYKIQRNKDFNNKISPEMHEEFFGNNKPFVINNVDKMTEMLDLKEFLQDLNVKSEIIIPFYYRYKPLGVFILSNANKIIKLEENKIKFLEFLIPLISACINIFYLNEKFKKTFEIEKVTQDIVNKLKYIQNHENLFNYILEKLIVAFDIDTAARFNFKNNKELILENFVSKTEITKHDISNIEINQILSEMNHLNTIIINDIKKETFSNYIKNYMKTIDTTALMIYPNLFNSQLLNQYKDLGFIALMKKNPKKWSSDEVYWFQLIIDTVNIAFSDYKEKIEHEESKKDFIATLAHDLKSPLLAEEKLLESILMGDENTPLKEITPWLEEIIKNNKELLSMISNLLSVYHYERSQFELNKSSFVYNDVINESINILQYLSKDKNISIKVNTNKKDLLTINGDKAALKRVISNILSNAIKYTKDNGEISISVKKKDDYIITSIKDQGPGIGKEEAKEIFNPYKSRKSTLGRGLGLYIAKKIVEAHNGNIWVDSTKEQTGSTFCFTLPLN